jgi:hypothetical protein
MARNRFDRSITESTTSGPFHQAPKLIGTTSPATDGLRTSTKNNQSLVERFRAVNSQVKRPPTVAVAFMP